MCLRYWNNHLVRASVSEPHTGGFNGDFSLSVIRRSVYTCILI